MTSGDSDPSAGATEEKYGREDFIETHKRFEETHKFMVGIHRHVYQENQTIRRRWTNNQFFRIVMVATSILSLCRSELKKIKPDEEAPTLESVRTLQAGLHSFLSMRRMEARRKKASALRLRFSQSLASLRQRLSQAMVRSTIQRLGTMLKPTAASGRLTISTLSEGRILTTALANCGP
jgi:hypothetical protein